METIIAIKSDETVFTTYGGGNYTAFASSLDADPIDPARYIIEYTRGAMPPHKAETFSDLDSLLAAMRKIAPLTEWRVTE